jgi:hypothetical protein
MWLQSASGYYYAKIHDVLTYPIIVFSSLSSAALFGSENEALKYTISAVTILTGILTVVTRQMKPGELYQEYSTNAKHYRLIIRKIDTCLDIPKDMRPDPGSFIEKIRSEIDSLSSSQPYPPMYVVRMFEKKFGKLETKMFGEDIAELLENDLKTRKLVRKIKRSSITESKEDEEKIRSQSEETRKT